MGDPWTHTVDSGIWSQCAQAWVPQGAEQRLGDHRHQAELRVDRPLSPTGFLFWSPRMGLGDSVDFWMAEISSFSEVGGHGHSSGAEL